VARSFRSTLNSPKLYSTPVCEISASVSSTVCGDDRRLVALPAESPNVASRVSYNGGNDGINAPPSSQDEAAVQELHLSPIAAQNQNLEAVCSNPQQRASVNQGKPPVAATPKPGPWQDNAPVASNQAGGAYHPPSTAPQIAGPGSAKPLRRSGSPLPLAINRS
jgi:hypothetical protein